MALLFYAFPDLLPPAGRVVAAGLVALVTGFLLARAFQSRSAACQAALIVARIREMLAGPASVALVLVMLVGCLVLWVGVPLAWLWIGSQVQSSASLGTALMVTMVGIVISIFVLVAGLSWVNRRHAALLESRDRPIRSSALEVILVSSAGIAIVGFGIWFFGFAGASPLPLNIGF